MTFPSVSAVTKPVLVMVATAGLELVHVPLEEGDINVVAPTQSVAGPVMTAAGQKSKGVGTLLLVGSPSLSGSGSMPSCERSVNKAPDGELALPKALLLYGPLLSPGVIVTVILIVPVCPTLRESVPSNKFLLLAPLKDGLTLKLLLAMLLTVNDKAPLKVAVRFSSTCNALKS